MKKELTCDEFGALCDRLEEATFRCGHWWPTMEEVKTFIEPNIKEDLEFALWISITADPPANDEQKEVRTYLNNLINKNLKFKEDRGVTT